MELELTNNPCEFCNGDKPLHENLKHRVVGAIRFVRINNCPMCGRNLCKEAGK